MRTYMKNSLRIAVSAIFVPICVAVVVYAAQIYPDIIVKGAPWYDIRGYSSITTALSAIGASEKTLLVLGNISVATDTVIPATTHVWYLGGGKFTIAVGKVLTHNGAITAGNHTIWVGPGTLVPPKVPLKLSWLGDLTKAVALLTTATCEVEINTSYTQAADVTTPATMTISFASPGQVSVDAAKTWTIQGPIYGRRGCFQGNGATVPSIYQTNAAEWWPSLAKCVADISTNNRIISINSPTVVSGNLTIPTTLSMIVNLGGLVNAAGGTTTTLNGPLIAGAYQIFAGNGTVVFGANIAIEILTEWWGAKPDGVTDCAAAIESAVNSLPGTVSTATIVDPLNISGKIKFNDGIYLIHSTKTFTKDNVIFEGNGAASVLHCDIADYHFRVEGSAITTVKHWKLNRLKFTGATSLGVYFDYSEFLKVTDCLFSGTVNGVSIAIAGTDIKPTVERCIFYGNSYGIKMGATRTADGNFNYNYFVNCTTRAFYSGYMDGGSITHNKIFNDLAAATENDGIAIAKPVYVKIAYNDIFEVNGYGIYLSSPRRSWINHNTIIKTGKTANKTALHLAQIAAPVVGELNEIAGNVIYQPYGGGIYADQLLDTELRGNKIVEAGYTTVGAGRIYDAITLATCTGIKMLENIIDGNSVTRYWLHTTASSGTIANNTIRENVNVDMYRSGVNTFILPPGGIITTMADADYTAVFHEDTILSGVLGASRTLTLPTATVCLGKIFNVMKTDNTAYSIIINPVGAEKVFPPQDNVGLDTYNLTQQGRSVTLLSDGVGWRIHATVNIEAVSPSLTGTADPTAGAGVQMAFIGQIYVKTDTGKVYVAKSLTATEWLILN